MGRPHRQSVDLSGFPDLVVIYLGYRATSLRGIRSLLRVGMNLRAIQKDPPDGLLLHEGMLFGLMHPGFRQYWRDFASLEAFTRAPRHAALWRDFGRDAGGGGFWHESYQVRGGMEGIYLNLPATGFARFAPSQAPEGARLSARGRLSTGDAASGRMPAPAV